MKNTCSIAIILPLCLGLTASAVAQSSTVQRARSAPGPDPELFDGSQMDAEDRPESGIISDIEMGSGEGAKQPSQSQRAKEQQKQGGQQQGGGGGGQGPEGEQQEGGGGGSEMIEEGQQDAQDFGQQGQQQGAQGQQGGQQGGQQSSSGSSSSEQSNQAPPSDDVKLGDESLKIETVDLPADETLIGQEDDGKREVKDTTGSGAGGKQSQQRRNTGVEQGDAMPSDL